MFFTLTQTLHLFIHILKTKLVSKIIAKIKTNL